MGNKPHYEVLLAAKPPLAYVKTEDEGLDKLGASVALYETSTYQFVKEYVEASENHREYVGLCNEIDRLRQKGYAEETAIAMAFANIEEADKTRSEKLLPRCKAGFEAVEKLKPENKIQTLLPLAQSVLETIPEIQEADQRIKFLVNEAIKSGDYSKILPLLQAGRYMLKQLNATQRLLECLIEQYRRNLAFRAYMQDIKTEPIAGQG